MMYPLTNIGTLLENQGSVNEALNYFKRALDLSQKSIKGREIDYREGHILCPNLKCQEMIEIKIIGHRGAVIEKCPSCQIQFSIWIADKSEMKYKIGIISEGFLQIEKANEGVINLQKRKGKETKTTFSEWLESGRLDSSL